MMLQAGKIFEDPRRRKMDPIPVKAKDNSRRRLGVDPNSLERRSENFYFNLVTLTKWPSALSTKYQSNM